MKETYTSSQQIIQALQEYTDRVISPEVERVENLLSNYKREISTAQLNGLYQRSRVVQSVNQLFSNKQADNENFEDFLTHRIDLSDRRRDSHVKEFYEEIARTLFGKESNSLKRAASSILKELAKEQGRFSSKEREFCQLFLFHEWMKQYYLKTKFYSEKYSRKRNR